MRVDAAPFAPGADREAYGDDESQGDDQPLKPPASTVGIDSEDNLYPVVPDHGYYQQPSTENRESQFQPEPAPKIMHMTLPGQYLNYDT